MEENYINEDENYRNDENHINQRISYQAPMQEDLPNHVGILVLGIVSIVTCWCYGIIGVILGTISLIMASKAQQLYMEDPERYTHSSYKNMNAGKVTAIVGLALSGIYLLVTLAYVLFVVGVATDSLSTDLFDLF